MTIDQALKCFEGMVNYCGGQRNAQAFEVISFELSQPKPEQSRVEPLVVPQLPDGSTRNPSPDFSSFRPAIDVFVKEYQAAVKDLFALRKDGPALHERDVRKDQKALDAFNRLDSATKRLNVILDQPNPEHSLDNSQRCNEVRS